MSTEVKCVRNRKYGTLYVSNNGWTKEVCNVTWNDKKSKLDIREWDSSYTKMRKGLTFSKEEAKKLLRILASVDFEEFDFNSTDTLPVTEQKEKHFEVRDNTQNTSSNEESEITGESEAKSEILSLSLPVLEEAEVF